MARAGAYSRDIVVEQQVRGENYRLLYLDGELVDAILRHPPKVYGDGHSTVRQLVSAENGDRVKRGAEVAQSLIRIDEDMRNTLRAQGYRLVSVPRRHAAVQLKTVVNDNRRDENEAAAGALCRSIIETGSAAADALGVRLAGVDVITTDPGAPLRESGGVVIEVNTTPGYYYHDLRSGTDTSVAASILRRLCEAAQ
jgi:cyanophycin synthetase